jgi:hypothetical protein
MAGVVKSAVSSGSGAQVSIPTLFPHEITGISTPIILV